MIKQHAKCGRTWNSLAEPYETHDELRAHLSDFVSAYNSARPG